MYKGVGVRFAIFLKYPIKMKQLRPKLFNFNRIFKNGDRVGGSREPPLDPHCG